MNHQISVIVPTHKLTERFTAADELIVAARSVVAVTNADQQSAAAAVAVDLRKHLNQVEAIRKDLTSPLLDAQRALKSDADAHCAPIEAEMRRIERLVTDFQAAERRRVAEAEEQRRLQVERLDRERREAEEKAKNGSAMEQIAAGQVAQQLASKADEVLRTPPPAPIKAGGVFATGKKLQWECTDVLALWAEHPELCNPPTPKASAILATCHPDRPIKGLKLWWEERTITRAR